MSHIQKKAGGVIIRTHSGVIEIFLIHRHRYNDWSLPKGHIDNGESLEAAALREVREETGFDCRILGVLPEMSYIDPAGQRHTVAWFAMSVVRETGEGLDEAEVDGGEWCNLETARERVSYDSSKEYINQISSMVMDYAATV